MIKPAGISLIKSEIKECSHDRLQELILRMAKYKVENKELLSYLLFEEDSEQSFLTSVKEEMNEQMLAINDQSPYLAKKTLRKVIRTSSKYIRFTNLKSFEVEIWIHFVSLLNPYSKLLKNKVIENMKSRALIKIRKALKYLHEDLQYDYREELKQIL